MYTAGDVRKLKAQRDELLEAAKMAHGVISSVDGYVYQRFKKVLQLESAIEKVEGRKNLWPNKSYHGAL